MIIQFWLILALHRQKWGFLHCSPLKCLLSMLKQEEPLEKCKSVSPRSCESMKIWKCSGHGMPEKSTLWIIEKSESVFSQRNPFHQMSPFNGPSVIIARSAGLIHFYKLQQRSEMVGIFFSCAVNIYDKIGFLKFVKLSPICAMCAICEMCA